MSLRGGRPTAEVKAGTLKNRDKRASWPFAFCTLLLIASVIRMCSQSFEIAAALGLYRAAGVLAGITGAALVVSHWVNTGNE
jgi:hypothetical protein